MISNKKVFAIIAARGGSKRLPRKNIYPVWGKPMIYWVIRAAYSSKYIDEVFVSSEDKEILDFSEKCGAKNIKRPDFLAQDQIYKQDVIVDAVKGMKIKPDIVVSLQPNSPELDPGDLDNAIEKMVEFDRNEIFSVNNNLIQNAAFRVMKWEYVFSKTISWRSGVYIADYVDVHDITDVEYLEKNKKPSQNHWEEALYKAKGETLEGNYLFDQKKKKATKKIFDYVDEKMKLSKDSKVLEIGCNMARNLREANKRYQCFVTGSDINKECIKKNNAHFGNRGDFYVADLRRHNFLSKYDDDYFDLGLTMGFLMHLPEGIKKEKLISEFLRVCKNVCIVEMYNNQKNAVDVDDEWHMSFEDYSKYSSEIINTQIKTCTNLTLFVAGKDLTN